MIGKLFGPSAALAFSSLLAVFAYAPNAGAAVIYDYVATCSVNCTGQASGVLTLKDTYTPGDLLTDADFEAFTYMSSSTIADDARFPDDTFNIPGDDAFFGFGGALQLPAVSGPAGFVLLTNGDSGGGDSFNFSSSTLTALIDLNSIRDSATDPVFTLRDTTEPPPPSSDVAEPGALGLLAMPLLAIGLLRRRRGTRAA